MFPRPRSRPPSASRSYVVVTEIIAVFRFDRHPRRSIRLSCSTLAVYVRLQSCSTLRCVRPAHLRELLDALCMHDPATTCSRFIRALYTRRLSLHSIHLDQLGILLLHKAYLSHMGRLAMRARGPPPTHGPAWPAPPGPAYQNRLQYASSIVSNPISLRHPMLPLSIYESISPMPLTADFRSDPLKPICHRVLLLTRHAAAAASRRNRPHDLRCCHVIHFQIASCTRPLQD